MSDLETLRLFWRSFCVSPLYNTGFSDAIMGSGATTSQDTSEMARALAYLTGYAQATRQANEYMSSHWQVAQLVGIAAAVLLTLLDGPDPTGRNRSIARLCEQYARELTALLNDRNAV